MIRRQRKSKATLETELLIQFLTIDFSKKCAFATT